MCIRDRLAVVGVAMLYRINPNTAIKQLIWIALGIIGYILIVVISVSYTHLKDNCCYYTNWAIWTWFFTQ